MFRAASYSARSLVIVSVSIQFSDRGKFSGPGHWHNTRNDTLRELKDKQRPFNTAMKQRFGSKELLVRVRDLECTPRGLSCALLCK